MSTLLKRISKIFIVFAAIALMLCLAGCGNQESDQKEQPEEQSKEQPLETKAGFYQDSYGSVNAAVLITNPNSDLKFDNAYLSITVKDADGKVVASDNEFMVGDVLPGEEFAVAVSSLLAGDRKAETIEVQIHSDSPVKSDEKPTVAIDEATVSTDFDNQASYDGVTYVTTNGEYTNETEEAYDAILITSLYFDKDENIITGAMDDQWSTSKGTSPFETCGLYKGSPKDVAAVKNYIHVYTMNHPQ